MPTNNSMGNWTTGPSGSISRGYTNGTRQAFMPSNDGLLSTDTTSLTGFAYPTGACFCSANQKIYITNNSANNVSVLDPFTNTVVATIAVLSLPVPLCFRPGINGGTPKVFVFGNPATFMSVINPLTNTVIATVATPSALPFGCVYCPDNDYVYVINTGTPGIIVVDASTHAIVTTINTPSGGPFQAAYNPITKRIYVPGATTVNLDVVNPFTNTIESSPTPPNALAGYGALFCPSNQLMYFSGNANTDGINVFDPASNQFISVIGASTTSAGYTSLTYNAHKDLIYAGTRSTEAVPHLTIIRPTDNKIVGRIDGPYSHYFSEYCPANGMTYSLDTYSNQVILIE